MGGANSSSWAHAEYSSFRSAPSSCAWRPFCVAAYRRRLALHDRRFPRCPSPPLPSPPRRSCPLKLPWPTPWPATPLLRHAHAQFFSSPLPVSRLRVSHPAASMALLGHCTFYLWFFIPTLDASLFSPTALHAVTGSAASCPVTGTLPACIPRPGSRPTASQPPTPALQASPLVPLQLHCNRLCRDHGHVCLVWSGLVVLLLHKFD